MEKVKLINRTAYLLAVLFTGAIAGAAVWLVLFLMDAGLELVWDKGASCFGVLFPAVVCTIGGLIIALYSRRVGNYPEDLTTVMAKVKRDGGYSYDSLGKISVAALLPLIFGGSVGPEAGLTGVIAGLCTWVGDRMKRFGSGFKELTEAGIMATMSALFTAPLYGLVGGIAVDKDCEVLVMGRWTKVLVYAVAIIGALGTMILLTRFVGGGLGLPHYDWDAIGSEELLWAVPLILIGSLAGWLFCVSHALLGRLSAKIGDRLWKPVLAGLILGVFGILLPFTMFSGEAQIDELDLVWGEMGAALLLITGFMKIVMTAMCVNMGWRGGHFFPLIFSGVAIGYGSAVLMGVDPVFALCIVTAALVGGVTRKPLMTMLLLFLCFPLLAAVPMLAAAFVGAHIPLPSKLKDNSEKDDTDAETSG